MAIPRWRSRYAPAWAESPDGAMNGRQSWAILCQCRCRLSSADRTHQRLRQERLQMWEAGEVHDLIGRVLGQQHIGQQAAMKKKA